MSTYLQRKQIAKDRIQHIQLQIDEVQAALVDQQQEFEENVYTRAKQAQVLKLIENYQQEFRHLQSEKERAKRHLSEIKEENRQQRIRRRQQRAIQQAFPQSSIISDGDSDTDE